MFLTGSHDGGKDINQNQCEIFNFADLCSGVGIMWSTTTQTRLNDATAKSYHIARKQNWVFFF